MPTGGTTSASLALYITGSTAESAAGGFDASGDFDDTEGEPARLEEFRVVPPRMGLVGGAASTSGEGTGFTVPRELRSTGGEGTGFAVRRGLRWTGGEGTGFPVWRGLGTSATLGLIASTALSGTLSVDAIDE